MTTATQDLANHGTSRSEIDPIRKVQLDKREIEFYQNEGYLVIPGLFSEDTAEQMRGEILGVLKDLGAKAGKLIQTGQYIRGTLMDRFVNSPELKRLAGELMGGPSSLYLPFTAVKSARGGGQFHFHQDNQYTHFDGPGINIWCAMVPMTPENGALNIAPRTHRLGTLESRPGPDGDGHRETALLPENYFPVRLNAGDAVAFTRLTIHGSGSNASPEDRVAYAMQYFRDDVKAYWPDEKSWKPLKDFPRWKSEAVDKIEKRDVEGE